MRTSGGTEEPKAQVGFDEVIGGFLKADFWTAFIVRGPGGTVSCW